MAPRRKQRIGDALAALQQHQPAAQHGSREAAACSGDRAANALAQQPRRLPGAGSGQVRPLQRLERCEARKFPAEVHTWGPSAGVSDLHGNIIAPLRSRPPRLNSLYSIEHGSQALAVRQACVQGSQGTRA